jgi:hypothetical protein
LAALFVVSGFDGNDRIHINAELADYKHHRADVLMAGGQHGCGADLTVMVFNRQQHGNIDERRDIRGPGPRLPIGFVCDIDSSWSRFKLSALA